MANPSFTLVIDVIKGELVDGSIKGGEIIPIIKNDVYDVELNFVKGTAYDSSSQTNFRYIPYLTNGTVKFGIGDIDDPPISGSFTLSCNGTTSSNIPYNATPAQIYSAISNNVSTVNSYGDRGYTLVASQPNTAMSFGADTNLLFPASSAIISTRLSPSSGVTAQQTLKLVKNPAIFVDSWSSASTANPITLTKTSAGGGGASTIYALSKEKDISSDSVFSISFGDESTSSIEAKGLERGNQIYLNQILQEAFGVTAVTKYVNVIQMLPNGFSRTGVTAVQDFIPNIIGSYSRYYNGMLLSFQGKYKGINVLTPLILNTENVTVNSGKRIGVVTFSTSGIEDLFAASPASDSITTTLEIEIVENGNPRTVLQTPVVLKKDLIVAGSSLPAAIQQYYTKTETDAIFVEDSVTNVDASNRKLANAAGIATVDYGQGIFGASGMVNMASSAITVGGFPVYIASSVTATGAVSFGGGMAVSGNLGFYGTSPIAKPSGANAISNVISLGLIASSSTYGVWPGSIKTLTTSVTLTFGNVAANDTTSVTTTITGSNINDIVLLGLPNSLCAGLSFYGHVTTADVVEIDAVNGINSSRDQSAQTYRITVVGY